MMINRGQTRLVHTVRDRVCLALTLAGLPLSIFGTALPVHAEDVAERVELEIKSVHIYDHREPFYELEGEIRLEARLWRVHQIEGCPRWTHDERCMETLASMTVSFDASSGDTVAIGRALPDQRSPGVGKYSDPSGPGIGIALRGDEVYGWEISAVDEDAVLDDRMGWLRGELSRANNWGTPGEYDERGWVECDEDGSSTGFCALSIVESPFNPPEAKAAHFSVLYELRRTPLPDLAATGFRYDTQRGAVCMRVSNVGSRAAEPFDIHFHADATPSAEAWQQSYSFLNGLGLNESQEPCLNPLLPAGERAVSFIIDDDDRLLEANEGNNRYDSKFTFLTFGPNGPQSIALPPGPVASNPTTGQADLTVTGIRVKGESAGSSGGCDPGKNDVTVSVKNQGIGPAASFVVRVTAKPEDDDDDVSVEKTAASLAAGAEQDVQFEELSLKKGFYEFEASADTKKSIVESNENNNDDHVSVNCQT